MPFVDARLALVSVVSAISLIHARRRWVVGGRGGVFARAGAGTAGLGAAGTTTAAHGRMGRGGQMQPGQGQQGGMGGQMQGGQGPQTHSGGS